MERGEVYYLKVDNSYGSEMSVGRPVLVVTANEYIDKFPTVTVVYLTTSSTRFGMKVRLRTPNRTSWARCDQVYTVDKERLTSIMCKLKPDEIAEVDDALSLVTGLRPKTEEILEVEKPVVVDDTEKIRLQIELDLYKKLYQDLTQQIVDARFDRQVVVEKATEEKATVTFIDEIVAPEVATEYIPNNGVDVDTETLKKMMSTPNDEMVAEEPVKKMGRPKGSKNKPKKVNINTANWETIREITGMNEKTAKNIERYRKKHGEFVDLTDLLYVPYFGRGCMDKYGQMLEV